MKASKQTALAMSMVLASFLFFGSAHAEDKTTTTQSHEEHHPDAKAQVNPKGPTGGDMMNNGMMGQMDMSQMMHMKHECMETHKDGKMCDQQCMDKCQEKMGKPECQKMMRQMKGKEKSEKKK